MNTQETIATIRLALHSFRDLTDKERKVLSMRFGTIDGVKHTLQEIGTELELTRERIRQIEERAFKKLSLSMKQKLSTEENLTGN